MYMSIRIVYALNNPGYVDCIANWDDPGFLVFAAEDVAVSYPDEFITFRECRLSGTVKERFIPGS